jgi:hypothetical protein
MLITVAVLAIFALGFGAGRVKHPANLTVANVKAEIVKLEAEAKAEVSKLSAEAQSAYIAIAARIKAIL